MAYQNYQVNLRDADEPMDPQEFKESFIQASREENKRVEFDLKYSVPKIRALFHKDVGISLMEDLAFSSSASISSFQLLYRNITHLATRLGDSEQSMPQLWKDLVKIVISDSPTVMEEPAVEESLGSKLKELESDGVHEEQTQDLNVAAIINYNHSHNLSSTTSTTNSYSHTVTPPKPTVSPEISVQQVNTMRPNIVTSLGSDTYTINMPMAPSASPPQEDNILGFAVLAVELVGALSNLAASSKPEHNQVLIYVVVACSTLAFSISSTAHVLHKKRPRIAKKMQKAAFLIVTDQQKMSHTGEKERMKNAEQRTIVFLLLLQPFFYVPCGAYWNAM